MINIQPRHPTVSVVMRTWNALPLVRLALQSLAENTSDVDYERIVVDDCSDAPTIDFLLRAGIEKLVLNKQRVGSQRTMREGTKIASGRYVALIDSDILVPKGWLNELIAELEEHRGQLISANRFRDMLHPDSGEPLKPIWYQFRERSNNANPRSLFLAYSGGRSITQFSRDVIAVSRPSVKLLTCPPEYVGSSCIVYEREFVEQIGGAVNKEYRLYGGEDVDLCWRIGQAGGKVMRSGQVHVHHFEHGSVLDNDFDFEHAIKENNKLLFHHWKGTLIDFIRERSQYPQDLVQLRQQYQMIDRFLEYYSRESLELENQTNLD